MSGISPEVRLVIEAIQRSIPLDTIKLPDEFFPAHLSVALIDAVVGSPLAQEPPAVRSAERYCRRFGIAWVRADRWEVPPVAEQETLGDLVRRFEDPGVEEMADGVFPTRPRVPGAESVLRAAGALRRMGVEVLQDVPAHSPGAVEDAIRSSGEVGGYAGRRLMMYAGEDDFVRGDVHVRRFVAHAIGERAVSADRAVSLVREAAYEMILSPRFLDHEIWKYGVACPTDSG